jgi:hypothetical protein
MANIEQVVNILAIATEIHAHVDVEEFYVGESRSSYLDANEDMYEDMIKNIDDLTFPCDRVAIVRDECAYNGESTVGVIIDVLYESSSICEEIADVFSNIDLSIFKDEEGTQDKEIDYKELILSEIEEKLPGLYNVLVEVLDGITDDDFDVMNDGHTLFDCEDTEEIVNGQTFEALAYWTIYWKPDRDNVEIAQLVGLTPFEYKEEFYLALGACGMDLTPKLDAYIALTVGVIPSDSQFFRQKDYFKDVVGETTYNKIIEKCTREKKRYVISFEAD